MPLLTRNVDNVLEYDIRRSSIGSYLLIILKVDASTMAMKAEVANIIYASFLMHKHLHEEQGHAFLYLLSSQKYL